jgi:hypothetical protein
MNHRLLTEEEKAQNKAGRIQRRAARAKFERLETRQRKLVEQHGIGLPMALMANPTGDFHPAFVGSGAQAAKFKTVLRLYAAYFGTSWGDQRIWDSIHFHEDSHSGANSKSASETPHPPLPNPSTLQKSRRTAITPNTIAQPPPPHPPLSPIEFNKLVDEEDPLEIVRQGNIEYQQQCIFDSLPEETQRRAREAVYFWSCWKTGKEVYHRGRRDQIIPDRGPRWACFDNFSLNKLLPGIRIPKSQRRLLYWAIMAKSSDKQLQHLDFYGDELSPLFRHPFPIRKPGELPVIIPPNPGLW